MLSARGIKARPRDLEVMIAHKPDLVELHCSLSDLRWKPERQYGLPLAVHVPEYAESGDLLDPASMDEPRRLAAEAVYVRTVESALEWGRAFCGVPRLVLHPGGATPENPDDSRKNRESRYEALGRTMLAMREAAGEHVDVLLENLPRSCWFYGGAWKANIILGGRELAEIGQRFGVGVTLDICHLFQACNELKLDFMEELRAALPQTRHVHYSDSIGTEGEGLQIGEGTLPLAEAFLHMDTAFRGREVYAVPEIWFGHECGGRAFVQAWAKMDELMGGIPMEGKIG